MIKVFHKMIKFNYNEIDKNVMITSFLDKTNSNKMK